MSRRKQRKPQQLISDCEGPSASENGDASEEDHPQIPPGAQSGGQRSLRGTSWSLPQGQKHLSRLSSTFIIRWGHSTRFLLEELGEATNPPLLRPRPCRAAQIN
ncbi:Sal-like protein 2 [Manis javanica]|nr:Sal-like protein 2 [Manis javanica]